MAEPCGIYASTDLSRFVVRVTDKTAVALPYDDAGLAILRYILTERELVEHAVISTPAAPTQQQVEDWMKAWRASGGIVKKGLVNAPADLSLEDLGL